MGIQNSSRAKFSGQNLASTNGYLYFASYSQIRKIEMPELTSIGNATINGYQIFLSVENANISLNLLDYGSHSVSISLYR